MPSAGSERQAAFAMFAVLSLIWGYNWIVMKTGLQYTGPLTFTALRSAVAAVVLFAALIASGRSLRPVAVGDTLLLGLLQTTGFMGLVQLALVQGGAGKVAVLAYTMPFWTVLLAWLWLGERMRPLQWLAVALAGVGLALILQPWNIESSAVSKLLAVAAGLSWAASIIVAKRLRARHQVDLLSLTTWQLAFGLIPLLALAWLVPERPIDWSPSLLGALLFAGIPGTALGWMMWLFVLHRLPAGTASLNSLAIPVIAVLAAWLHFGERPDMAEAMGMVVIAVGLGLMSATALGEEQPADLSGGQG